MDPQRAFIALGTALALGLLVGLQRERAKDAVAGFRTFALITLLGCACAILTDHLGSWVVPAGLLGVAAATGVGNRLRPRSSGAPGITTEVAALLMFVVGSMLWLLPAEVGVVVGVTCALLLHLKDHMHALAGRISERDMHAIMQFAAVAFVVLPLLPDRALDPLGVLNPRHIWMMVVLVVAISLFAYVLLKFVGARGGLVVGGLIGGLISSTAATASYARRAAGRPEAAPAALLAILLAQCVLYARVLVEIGVVAPRIFPQLAPQVVLVGLAAALIAGAALARSPRAASELPEPQNPTELRAALWFGLLYALVLFGVAAARRHLGDSAVLLVAAISGLTDMDAIAISSAQLAETGLLEPAAAARCVVVAAMSNALFKLGLVRVLAGPGLFRLCLLPTLVLIGTSVLVVWVVPAEWPHW